MVGWPGLHIESVSHRFILPIVLVLAAGVRVGVADSVQLPAPRLDGPVSLERALGMRRSVRDYSDGALTLAEAGQLLWAAQGITDPATGYRTAPSAGAFHPLEIRLAARRVEGLAPGLYRYQPSGHRLQLVRAGDAIPALGAAAHGQPPFARAAAVLVISGDPARTTAKYGSRTERYLQLEAGHAAQNAALQAAALGLGLVTVGAFDDDALARAAGLPAGHRPLYLLPVGRPVE